MFDVKNCVKERYFPIKMYCIENGKEKSFELNVEPPKLKTLKKLMTITEKSDMSANDFKYIVTALLAKNKEHRVVDKFVDELSIDQLKAIYTAFMEWLNDNKNEKN